MSTSDLALHETIFRDAAWGEQQTTRRSACDHYLLLGAGAVSVGFGAAGHLAAALRISARDRWIAWSEVQRRVRLNRVVCMSRFLIRLSVRCPHLARHVLGRLLRRLLGDF